MLQFTGFFFGGARSLPTPACRCRVFTLSRLRTAGLVQAAAAPKASRPKIIIAAAWTGSSGASSFAPVGAAPPPCARFSTRGRVPAPPRRTAYRIFQITAPDQSLTQVVRVAGAPRRPARRSAAPARVSRRARSFFPLRAITCAAAIGVFQVGVHRLVSWCWESVRADLLITGGSP